MQTALHLGLRCGLGVLLGVVSAFPPRVAAHDGHEHTPVGKWLFWPDYTLGGKARNPIGPQADAIPSPFAPIDAESAPLLLWGEAPTQRVPRLLSHDRLPTRAFSAEVWLVDHVNQPVGALVAAKGRSSLDDPGWVLGYHNGQVIFSLRAGAEPAPVVLEAAATNAFKRYWHHIVGTYDGTRACLYVNGRLMAEKKAAGTVDLPARAELEVAAYLRREPFMELANLIRDVRLYDDDIGPTQVRQRFEALQAMVEEGIIFDDRFHFIAGPYLNRMSQKSVTLVWETDRPATGVVRFGHRLPYDREVRTTAPSRLQTIELTGLEPETIHFYELTAISTNETEITSGPLTFKTAVHETSPVAFAILGDTEGRPHINNQIAKAIWGERPDFVVCVGDLTDGGQAHHKFEWNLEYFLGMNQLVSRIPLFPVPGNGESDLHWYLRYHGLARSGHRYSFKYGNAEFFMLDSNRPLGPGSEQYDWLDKALAASRAQWKFVCHHHPVYSSDEDDFGDTHAGPSTGGDSNPRSAVPLYEKYGVDIVFYGHIHAYERTWPMAGGAVNVQRGVRYVQTGGGGGNLEDFSPGRNAFTGKLYRGHHYCLINIHGGSLRFQMFDVEGRLRDAFEMTK